MLSEIARHFVGCEALRLTISIWSPYDCIIHCVQTHKEVSQSFLGALCIHINTAVESKFARVRWGLMLEILVLRVEQLYIVKKLAWIWVSSPSMPRKLHVASAAAN